VEDKMKVKKTCNEKDFEPVTISITFETEDEAGAFYAIANYNDICDFAGSYGVDFSIIRKTLGSEFGRGDYYNKFVKILRKG
jgi:hypothetical protein